MAEQWSSRLFGNHAPLVRQTNARSVENAADDNSSLMAPVRDSPNQQPTTQSQSQTQLQNQENIRSPLVVVVLDSSGSMNIISHDILAAVNGFIEQQKAGPVDGTRLSFIVFAAEATARFIKRPIAEVQPVVRSDYLCDGPTALFDAINLAIDRHDDEKEALLVIVTDGEENSSKMSHGALQTKIEAKKAAGWKFIYLANEPRVARIGVSLGLECAPDGARHSSVNNVAVGSENLAQVLVRQVSGAVSTYRDIGEVPNLNGLVRSQTF